MIAQISLHVPGRARGRIPVAVLVDPVEMFPHRTGAETAQVVLDRAVEDRPEHQALLLDGLSPLAEPFRQHDPPEEVQTRKRADGTRGTLARLGAFAGIEARPEVVERSV